MGFVFQQPTLLKNLDILDNILLPALRGSHKNIAALTEKAEMLMGKVAANAERVLFMRDGSIVDELRLSKTGHSKEENIKRVAQRLEYLGI